MVFFVYLVAFLGFFGVALFFVTLCEGVSATPLEIKGKFDPSKYKEVHGWSDV
jgi:hypothetical protein